MLSKRSLQVMGFLVLMAFGWAGTVFAATISGTVTNASGQTGRIFLRVFWNNGGPGHWGKSIASAGAYSIRGVPEGTYVVAGFVDKNGDGIPNVSEGFGISAPFNLASNGTVSPPASSDLTLYPQNPLDVAPQSPEFLMDLPLDGGVLLMWEPPLGGPNGIFVMADSYKIQWSADNFSTVLGSRTVSAGSGFDDGIFFVPNLSNGTSYKFRVSSIVGGSEAVPVETEATPSAPGGRTVSGTVNLGAGVSVGADVPLIAILEGVGGESVFLRAYPTFTNGASFSIGGVEDGYYHLHALLDVNKDNRPSAGDYWTNAVPVTVSGANVGGKILTVSNANAKAAIEVEHTFADSHPRGEYFGVAGFVESGAKRPVNAYLTGPALSGGVDTAWDFNEAYYWQWTETRPQLTDVYSFEVSYSDGTSETLTASPTAVYDEPVPTNITPAGTVLQGATGYTPASISWTGNESLPAGWVVDVGISGWNGGFWWEPESMPGPTDTSVAYDGEPLPAGNYNVLVKFCEDWNWNCVTRSQYLSVVVDTCGIPSNLMVGTADLDGDGNYQVTWGTSSTAGVTYVLEEATNNSFTANLRTAYTGTGNLANITGRSYGTTYYYRVKATKTDYADSSWRTTGNGIFIGNPDDIDGDMIPAASDNCPNVNNPSQSNADGDSFGDACDEGDFDGDGVADYLEVQWGTNVSNPDSDGDGLKDGIDTQPLVYQTPLDDNTAFVRQVYLDFLNREPDLGGLNYWVSELDAGNRTRAQVVEEYLLSAEFGQTIAPVARLYFAYFLRIPDFGGLMYWVDRYSQGTTLNEISDFFAASEEFQTTYGSLSNAEFVNLIYQNVLGREADSGGLAYWANELETSAKTRGQVMTGFSESPEYKTLMGSEVYVTMTYIGLLQRSPEPGGYSYWVGQMDGGSSGLALIDGFLYSQEYHNRFTVPD